MRIGERRGPPERDLRLRAASPSGMHRGRPAPTRVGPDHQGLSAPRRGARRRPAPAPAAREGSQIAPPRRRPGPEGWRRGSDFRGVCLGFCRQPDGRAGPRASTGRDALALATRNAFACGAIGRRAMVPGPGRGPRASRLALHARTGSQVIGSPTHVGSAPRPHHRALRRPPRPPSARGSTDAGRPDALQHRRHLHPPRERDPPAGGAALLELRQRPLRRRRGIAEHQQALLGSSHAQRAAAGHWVRRGLGGLQRQHPRSESDRTRARCGRRDRPDPRRDDALLHLLPDCVLRPAPDLSGRSRDAPSGSRPIDDIRTHVLAHTQRRQHQQAEHQLGHDQSHLRDRPHSGRGGRNVRPARQHATDDDRPGQRAERDRPAIRSRWHARRRSPLHEPRGERHPADRHRPRDRPAVRQRPNAGGVRLRLGVRKATDRHRDGSHNERRPLRDDV